MRGVFADSLETKYQGAGSDRGFGGSGRLKAMVFFGSQEVLFLWDLWQFPTGRNQEKLFFVLGLEHRIQGGLGHWGVGVMMFPYASIPNRIHTWLCKRT